MPQRNTYSMDLKLRVVRDYDEGLGGYKALAKKYNLSRDLVCSWVMNARLHAKGEIPPCPIPPPPAKDLDYYKKAAAYWEAYAHKLEREMAELGAAH